jgi:hypothetical protein
MWLSDTLHLSGTEAQDEQQSIIVGKLQRRTRPKSDGFFIIISL